MTKDEVLKTLKEEQLQAWKRGNFNVSGAYRNAYNITNKLKEIKTNNELERENKQLKQKLSNLMADLYD